MIVCSTAFAPMGRMQAKALGVPQLPVVVIAHPFGVRSREEVRAMAGRCADEVARLLREGTAQ